MSRTVWITAALWTVWAALVVAGTARGAADIPAEKVWGILTGSVDSSDPDHYIVLNLRLPQMVLLGLVGAALACSGAALQATMENPLADPGVLGVTGGAALGAVLAIHTRFSEQVFLALPLTAFAGAAGAALLVYGLAYVHGRPGVASLLLTGVAVGGMAFAGVTLVMLMTDAYRVHELLYWLTGGVRNQTWDHVLLAAPGVIIAVVLLAGMHRRLDALLLGEEQALAVGVPVTQTRLTVIALSALAVGAATAAAGSIGFVGLIVPHLVRQLTGPRAAVLLPACAAGGAVFLTACELGGRVISPRSPLYVGILTAFLGGPTLLFLLRRQVGGRS